MNNEAGVETLAFLRLWRSAGNELTKAEVFTDGNFHGNTAPGLLFAGNSSLPQGQSDPRNAAVRPEPAEHEKTAQSCN